MSTRIQAFRHTEDRLRASIASALSSAFLIYAALLGVIILGLLLARS